MAVTADQVVVELQLRGADSYIQAVQRSRSAFDRSMTQMGVAARRAEREIILSSTAISNAFRQLAGVVGAGLGVRGVGQMADSYIRLQNSLRVAGLEGEALLRVQDALFEAANRNGTDVETLAQVYNRAALAGKELGASQQQLLTFVNAIADALRVQGGSAAAASGALLQLSQAVGSGIVRAEEFNSILEGALPIAQAAARGIDRFGGSVQRLREAVLAGEVTSREFFGGIIRDAPNLAEQASRANLTLANSFTVLSNQLLRYVGGAAQSSGISTALAKGIQELANNLDAIIPALTVIATALGVRWVVAANRARIAMVLLAASMSATSVATSALTAAGRSLLALVGGPMGLAVLALAGAVAVFSSRAAAAEERTQRLNMEMEALGIRTKAAADDIDDTVASLEKLGAAEIRQKLREIREEMDALRGSSWLNFDTSTLEGAAATLEAMVGNVVLFTNAEREAAAELAPLVRGLLDGERNAAEVLARLEEIAKISVSGRVDDLIVSLQQAIVRAGELDEYFRHIERSAGGAAAAIREAREAEVSGAPSTAEPSKALVALIRQYRELGEQREAFVRGGVEAYRAVEQQQRDLAAAERDAAKAAKEAGEEGTAAYQAVYDATLKATLAQQELAREAKKAEDRQKARRNDTDTERRKEALAALRDEVTLNDELISRFDEGEAALSQIRSAYEALAQAKKLGLEPGTPEFDRFIDDSATIAAQERRLALLEEGRDLTESLWTVEEQRAATQARLNRLREAGAISEETYWEALRQTTEEYARQQALVEELETFGERAFDRIGAAITEAFAQGELAMISFGDLGKAIISEIMQEFIKLALLNPIKNALGLGNGNLPTIYDWMFGGGGSTGGSVSTGNVINPGAPVFQMHGGGIAGQEGGSRLVNPAVFANAPRLHSGGLAGGEVPAILMRGEEVLTASDPRHRRNGGLASAAPRVEVNIINNTSAQVTQRRRSDGLGLDVIIDEMTAGNLARRGSRSNQALREMGGRAPLASR